MKLARVSLQEKTQSILSQKQYLFLAIPLIISGITTPILGAVDTAVVGRIPDPAAIGGVAIGAVIFNTMYWLLGFLRVSTSGFTSQAEGANNEREVVLTFLRPMIIAILFGLLFIIFQSPILHISMIVIGASEHVNQFASTYFSIRIWGAPFTLLNYVIVGWLMGLGKVKLSLASQISMNVLNIILSIVFVIGFNLGIAGAAYATLIAEMSAVLFGIWLIFISKKLSLKNVHVNMLFDSEPLLSMLNVNRDLFLRTVCLLAMTVSFTAMGASLGEVTLAANAVLLQVHYIMAYLIGGFANASSILIGRSIGKKDKLLYKRVFLLSVQWGLVSSILLSGCMFLLGEAIVSLFSTDTAVIETAASYLIWMIVFPFAGFWGLQLEGIFSGATEARFIRNSIIYALIIYLIAILLFPSAFHNHGVWLSFILFSLSRTVFLGLYVRTLTRIKFS
ncbi:MATE family efflux transporter [Evansella halocellulosilytica]|uniref:MATE family efflux transporter n=1 Tax=Evansella halocellulosilytica TaxID=2011013 RepID=UPI000BB68C71|nr:MATE family efflux transporter [Evansella halocellulosilytica]